METRLMGFFTDTFNQQDCIKLIKVLIIIKKQTDFKHLMHATNIFIEFIWENKLEKTNKLKT